jgi:hypothetical protein
MFLLSAYPIVYSRWLDVPVRIWNHLANLSRHVFVAIEDHLGRWIRSCDGRQSIVVHRAYTVVRFMREAGKTHAKQVERKSSNSWCSGIRLPVTALEAIMSWRLPRA